MAIYRQVYITFWQDPFIMELTPEEKYFYLYLMTNSKTKQCGCYELPKKIMEFETGYNRETVDKLLDRFIGYGKIKYDENTSEVLMVNWLKYNMTQSPKIMSCIKQEILSIKNQEYVDFIKNVLSRAGENDLELYRMANKSEISKKLALTIMERDGFKCVRCGVLGDLTIDHIFPRSFGGSNAPDNLRVLCRSCNSKRPTTGDALLKDLELDGYSLDDFDTLSGINDTLSRKQGEEQEEEQTEEQEQEEEEQKKQIPYSEIISHLNNKAGKNYKATTRVTKDAIKARWNEGHRLKDFKAVIDKKCSQWGNDEKMEGYLRPQTLFGTKFEAYLNEKGGFSSGRDSNAPGSDQGQGGKYEHLYEG